MNHGYLMDYIDDPNLYKAVMFACRLLRQGKTINKAVGVASNYYKVNPNDVRHFVSQRSSRSQANKKSSKYDK